MEGMKSLLLALFVALLMVGCGEEAQKEAVQEEAKDDPSVPLAIPCVACRNLVSKKTEECRQCGHPTPDSVVAYKEAQELERIRAEEERRLAAIRAEEERRLASIRAEEERKRQEKEAKAEAKRLGLDDHTIILNTVHLDNAGNNYTGWAKATYHNGKIKDLGKLKDGSPDGLWTRWYENGQKWEETNFKDGKLDGLSTFWYDNGQKKQELNYENGELYGLSTFWHESGQKMEEKNYKDGKMDGLWTSWYENGQMRGKKTTRTASSCQPKFGN